MACQTRACAGRRGLARVVGLHGAKRDQSIRALSQGVAQQVLELARFVAAYRESSAIVALHPDGGSAQFLTEAGQPF